MIQDAKETLSCLLYDILYKCKFLDTCGWQHSVSLDPPFPHHFLTIHSCISIFHLYHFTKTPFRKTNRKVYSGFTLPASHKTFTITFLFANRMWCSITLTHLLLFDTSMQFSDGFLRVILSLGCPYVFSSFIYTLSLDEFILWPLQLHLKLFPFHFSQVRQLLISSTARSWDWIARANLSLTLQIFPTFEWSQSNPQFSPCLSLIFGTSGYYRWHHITSSTIL